MRCLLSCCLICVTFVSVSLAEDQPTYLLSPELTAGDTSEVKVNVEVGGEIHQTFEDKKQQLPLSVTAELAYLETMLTWSPDVDEPARSLREYVKAEAKIQKGKYGHLRELPLEKRTIAAEVREDRVKLSGVDTPLTRDQYDLINTVGNTLILNRLLPNEELAEGDSWKHDNSTIGALLGMDNIVVCEMSSIVTGCEHHQVQIRLAGTVHGTIDGAPTEMDLRAAYLFHQEKKRITKFNLAIKEKRNASQLVPGLDVVAKVSVIVSPTESETELQNRAQLSNTTASLSTDLSYEAPERGYQFLHDAAWYVIAEQRDRVSLRSLHEGNVTAHCSLTTLPARGEGRETTLEQFERDVREMLGEHLSTVSASTSWTTEQGHNCLGVVAQGETEGIAIEWRHYLIASPDRPRVSMSVTIEQSQLESFGDADRQLVDTLELLEKPVTKTAKKAATQTSR